MLEAAPAFSGVVVAQGSRVPAASECGQALALRRRRRPRRASRSSAARPNVRAGITAAFAPRRREAARRHRDPAGEAARHRLGGHALLRARARARRGRRRHLDPRGRGRCRARRWSSTLALDDAILDIDLTPNRGDCFSVLGIAREIAAKRGSSSSARCGDPVVPLDPRTSFPSELEAPDALPALRAAAIDSQRRVSGAKSPLWMRERLRRAGLRAIHPIVDVTNYVMLELGQPLHAYDLAKLAGRIVPRMARAGRTLELLDGRSVELEPDVLVIADERGPVGLAGIMGGAQHRGRPPRRPTCCSRPRSSRPPPSPDARAPLRPAHRCFRALRARRRSHRPDAARSSAQRRCSSRSRGDGRARCSSPSSPSGCRSGRAFDLRKRRVETLLGLELDAGDIEASLDRLGIDLEARAGRMGRDAAAASLRSRRSRKISSRKSAACSVTTAIPAATGPGRRPPRRGHRAADRRRPPRGPARRARLPRKSSPTDSSIADPRRGGEPGRADASRSRIRSRAT